MNPQIAFILNKSLESLRNSNLESAELYLKQALRLQSNNPHVLRLLGVISAQRGQYSDALKYLNNSLKSLPKNALTLSNIGNVFLGLKEYSNALDAYDKSIRIDSKYHEAWSNKGNALYELKRFDEAIFHHDKALSLKPDYAEGWSNKGNVLHELKRFDEAIAYYDKALSLKPDYAEGWFNKANTLHELKRFDEAIAYYDKALSLKPDYAEGWSNKGITLNELKRYIEAIRHFDKALSLNKDIDWIGAELLHTKMKICDWLDINDSLDDISKKVVANKKVIQPFQLLALVDDLHLHKKSSEIYIQSRYPFNASLGPIATHLKSSKIRIGYFSADFRDHAVAYLITELFELHDRNGFEIIAFSFGTNDGSVIRSRLIEAFDQFINVVNSSDKEIASLSRELKIDIAIDLGGHSAKSRTGIFAYRAAPIQASYIGYLGTMGAEYYDYLLADKNIIPNGSEGYYSEKIIYLPTYQVNDRKRIISDRQYTRQELGLPDQGFVFCCFNNNYKMLSTTFDGWMRILNRVEHSVLFLYAENEWSKINLINEAKLRGIERSRLVFGERIPYGEYLARYQLCDLFLDTFPYNAGTTASDALWTGLPVLTLSGQSFASRMAASLLNAIGLSELITSTQEEYEALAIELAMSPNKLAHIKVKLANNRLTTSLFDTPLFTKNLEAAYIKMYERYQADLEPDHITIL